MHSGAYLVILITITFIGLPVLGCMSSGQHQLSAEIQPADSTKSVPALSLADQQALQPCIIDLKQPKLIALEQSLSISKHSSRTHLTSYYVAFSLEGLSEPVDMRQIEQTRTISLEGNSCTLLSPTQVQELAQQQFKIRHKDLMSLYQGRQEAVWNDIVNRWEQNHYVSGPGDHPFLLDIEDIWIAKSLKLLLPDYAPIHIRDKI